MLSEPPAQHGTWLALSCFSQADMEGRVDAQSPDHSLGSRALVLRQQADPETAGTKVPLSGVNGRGGFSAFFCRASCLLIMRLLSCVPVPLYRAVSLSAFCQCPPEPQANGSLQLCKVPSPLVSHPSCLLWLPCESASSLGLPAS